LSDEDPGAAVTREQLRAAGFEILDTWNVPETLQDEANENGRRDQEREEEHHDEGGEEATVDLEGSVASGDKTGSDGDDDGDFDGDDGAWTFFAARLRAEAHLLGELGGTAGVTPSSETPENEPRSRRNRTEPEPMPDWSRWRTGADQVIE